MGNMPLVRCCLPVISLDAQAYLGNRNPGSVVSHCPGSGLQVCHIDYWQSGFLSEGRPRQSHRSL